MSAPQGPSIGSLAMEALRLAEAVRARIAETVAAPAPAREDSEPQAGDPWRDAVAADAAGNASAASAAAAAADERHSGPTCRYCPLCQAMSRLAETHPDRYEQVRQAGSSLVETLRTAVLAAEREWVRRPATVERIRLDEDGDDPDGDDPDGDDPDGDDPDGDDPDGDDPDGDDPGSDDPGSDDPGSDDPDGDDPGSDDPGSDDPDPSAGHA